MFPMQGNQPDDKLYVDDVFSAYTYTGNGSTQTITNGINLAGDGGLVWTKARSGTWSTSYHHLWDTARGAGYALTSNATDASSSQPTGLTSFNSSGFSLGAQNADNGATTEFASWTFRKAPKFFDVRVISGTGSPQVIPHSLGVTPGMVIIRESNTTANWFVWHRSLSSPFTKTLYLQTTDAEISNPNVIAVSATSITSNGFPAGSNNLIAYFFAHDTSADGIIQCGSFTTNGSGNATVNLGWEPQYVLYKCSTTVENWTMYDTARGLGVGTTDYRLYPNLSNAEDGPVSRISPTATGFTIDNGSVSQTFIYMAIRRPNKPPTSGTQVYNAIARTGTGAAATVTGVGFAPDLMWTSNRSTFDPGRFSLDRLRGGLPFLRLHNASAETLLDNATVYGMDGVTFGADTSGYVNYSAQNYINHFFKRAPGVFDQVCYTGDGSAGRAVSHNLAAVPELMIVKDRSSSNEWAVYSSAIGNANALYLQSTSASFSATTFWNSTTPTASVFTLGAASKVNSSLPDTYVAYLFATKPGISKCGNYTGNGTSQTIDCGFSTGARFILIKRTDSTGDWYVWDTVRGIIAGNDPHLSLNTTVAEVTSDDSIDPASSGFIVNQLAATNINVTSAGYVFLAIA